MARAPASLFLASCWRALVRPMQAEAPAAVTSFSAGAPVVPQRGHSCRWMVYVNTVFQRSSEARVSLSLKLEGTLSGHLDPDIYVRGRKGVNTQQLLTAYCVPGTVRGTSHHSLPIGRNDSSFCLNYFLPQISIWRPPSPPSRFFSNVPFLASPALTASFTTKTQRVK